MFDITTTRGQLSVVYDSELSFLRFEGQQMQDPTTRVQLSAVYDSEQSFLQKMKGTAMIMGNLIILHSAYELGSYITAKLYNCNNTTAAVI